MFVAKIMFLPAALPLPHAANFSYLFFYFPPKSS